MIIPFLPDYEIEDFKGAASILANNHPSEWQDICATLQAFSFSRSDILAKGGGKSLIAGRLQKPLDEKGWTEKSFKLDVVYDNKVYKAVTHKIDSQKGRVALEFEWNNKDPFFHRDLNAFRMLFDAGLIDVAVIVTRSSSLQKFFREMVQTHGLSKDKFVSSTTHMKNLINAVVSKAAGDCPILAIAISEAQRIEDVIPLEPSSESCYGDDIFQFGS